MIKGRWWTSLLVGFVLIALSGYQFPGEHSSDPDPFAERTTHYKVDAHIEPNIGHFDVTVKMHFVPEATTDTLRFLLHDDLAVEELRSPHVNDYETSPWQFGERDSLHTKVVTVPLTQSASPSNPLTLTWTYKGELENGKLPTLGGAVVSRHWTELPFEAMWLPIAASLRQRFTFEATVDLPEGYTLVSCGPAKNTSAGWYVQSRIPGPDVPLIISDQMKQRKRSEGGPPVSVYHAGAPDSTVTFVADSAVEILNRYDRRFGSGRQADSLRITLAPIRRVRASSYARPGLIAAEHGIEPDTSLYHLLAHEAAHLWWIDSVDPLSRHNFLNESFAEYASWLALREGYGEEAFRSKLASARTVTPDTLSFNEWTPELDGRLSYNKGPLLLHRLRQRIGEKNFLHFLRSLQRGDVGTLGRMLKVLETVTDPETAKWFERQL